MKIRILIPVLVIFFILSPAQAAPPKKPASKPVVTTSSTQAAASKILWDDWFILTLQGAVPAAYYNERCELDAAGRWVYKNKTFKLEEGAINEESLTAVAASEPFLKPILFNFHSLAQSVETLIDGTLQQDGTLIVKIIKNGQELPAIRKRINSEAFFSSLFPVLIHEKLQKMKTGQTYSFQAILEDNLEVAFSPQPGSIQLKPDDEFSKKTHTKKIAVNHVGQLSIWYLENSGLPLRIEFPTRKAMIDRTTKEKAEKFLQSSTGK